MSDAPRSQTTVARREGPHVPDDPRHLPDEGRPGAGRSTSARRRTSAPAPARTSRRRPPTTGGSATGSARSSTSTSSPADSEVDALLMEARLIKDIQPKHNQDLKDDKSFPYLQITTGEDFPRVNFTREPLERGVKLYGPFPRAKSLRGAIQVLQKIFKFRTCSLDIEEGDPRWRWFRPCLLHSIDQCTAPCNLRIDREAYRTDIRRLRLFLDGKKDAVLAEMEEEMKRGEQGPPVREGRPAPRRDQGPQDPEPPRRPRQARPARGLLRRPAQGPEGPAEGPAPGVDPADDRRRRHRPPRRHRDGRLARDVHRRPAVQAGLPPLQDQERRGRRRLRLDPRGRQPPHPGPPGARRALPRHLPDRRRQGPAQRRPRRLQGPGRHAADPDLAGQARGRDLRPRPVRPDRPEPSLVRPPAAAIRPRRGPPVRPALPPHAEEEADASARRVV